MKRRNDLILAGGLILLALVLLLVVKIYSTDTKAPVVVVTVNDTEYGRYPLNQDITVPIELEGGAYNVLVIKDGMADVTEASCKDKICVRHRKISKNGETIICLPNKMVVKIENGVESEVDATTN